MVKPSSRGHKNQSPWWSKIWPLGQCPAYWTCHRDHVKMWISFHRHVYKTCAKSAEEANDQRSHDQQFNVLSHFIEPRNPLVIAKVLIMSAKQYVLWQRLLVAYLVVIILLFLNNRKWVHSEQWSAQLYFSDSLAAKYQANKMLPCQISGQWYINMIGICWAGFQERHLKRQRDS